MKKRVLVLLAALVFGVATAYAGNGDLVVNGKLGVGTTSPSTYKLEVNSGYSYNFPAKVGGPDGYLVFGPANPFYSHFETDRPAFYFNKTVWVDGTLGGYRRSLYSTYGALTIQGTKNNWSGINFRDESNNNMGTLMMSPYYSGFFNAADNNWRFYASDQGYTYAYAYLYLSEVSLKKDIETIPNTIDKLKALRGVYYKLKNEKQDQGRQLGVIAQEVETVYPELVKEIDNPQCIANLDKACDQPKIKTVDYPRLSAVALQGVKELADRVENLEKRLEKLEKALTAGKQ